MLRLASCRFMMMAEEPEILNDLATKNVETGETESAGGAPENAPVL